ncbi:TNT domain-containing protein [Streptosporangium sp. NPDC000563]|uniref:TNT domain-containing protein n=1 Tax=unclassified Streptosporangium TaxID=2632669 RepID=UPI00332DE5CD
MPHYRRSVVLATAICALVCAMSDTAARADSPAQRKTPLITLADLQPAPPSAERVAHDQSPQNGAQVCGPPYVTGDPDLGPTLLPRTGYLGALLRGYVPLGGLTPQHFLSRYWNYTVNDYRYPPNSGFANSGDYPNGRPLVKTTFLQIGMRLDRFGGYGGSFLAPMGDLFTRRALPPRNLNTNPLDPTHLCNYHVFKVLKSFRVDVGPVSLAFEMPGWGTQYHVLSKYIPEAPQTSEEVPVSWLLQNGYLEELPPPVLPDPPPPHRITVPTTLSEDADQDEPTERADDRKPLCSPSARAKRSATGRCFASAGREGLGPDTRHASPSRGRAVNRPPTAADRRISAAGRPADRPRPHRSSRL